MRDPGTSATPTGRVHWPALDGLRALAVALVFAYHAERSVMPRGGAIGVTMFFALSGFLITTLLLRERTGTGRIGILDFYRRRALRLLPALVVLVVVTTAYAQVSGNLIRTRDAALPVLLYVFNWFRAFPGDGGGYGLLEHAWSLAVEEQFYVVWPLVVVAALAVAPVRRRALGVLVVAVGGSVASLVWRLQLWVVDEPRRSAARLYNGTDTVVDQLLVGAALAAALALWDQRAGAGDPAGARTGWHRVATVAAPVALAYLVWVAAVQPGAGGPGPANDRLYLEWGSLSFALATCVVVVACTRAPDAWLPRLLSLPPMVAVGKVSYGIYLWHVPVILVTDVHLPDATDAVRGTVVVAATAVATLVSWHLVERPFLARKRRGPGQAAAVRASVPVTSR